MIQKDNFDLNMFWSLKAHSKEIRTPEESPSTSNNYPHSYTNNLTKKMPT
jgi:hypothetical protein